jgi:hypothetical protein
LAWRCTIEVPATQEDKAGGLLEPGVQEQHGQQRETLCLTKNKQRAAIEIRQL